MNLRKKNKIFLQKTVKYIMKVTGSTALRR